MWEKLKDIKYYSCETISYKPPIRCDKISGFFGWGSDAKQARPEGGRSGLASGFGSKSGGRSRANRELRSVATPTGGTPQKKEIV